MRTVPTQAITAMEATTMTRKAVVLISVWSFKARLMTVPVAPKSKPSREIAAKKTGTTRKARATLLITESSSTRVLGAPWLATSLLPEH